MEIKVIPAKYVVSGFEFDTEQEAQDYIDNIKKEKTEQQTDKLRDGYLYIVDLIGGWWQDGEYSTVIGTKDDIKGIICDEVMDIRVEVNLSNIKGHNPIGKWGDVVFGGDFINMLEKGMK